MDLKPSIAIIGAGFGGLCAALRLKQAGFERLTIFERADRVGGTWHYNTYPGCACDVPVQLYSFSFEPNADWNYFYARHDEIQKYCERLADKYHLRSHLRFSAEIQSATWDSARHKWRLTLATGEIRDVDVLISSVGQLNIPAFPAIEGRESFGGQSFHSARWPDDVRLRAKRVAVIGTAASAVQFIPEIAREAGHVTVFQRTPNYILPRRDRAFSGFEKYLFRNAPWTMRITRNRIYWWAEWMFWGAFDPNDWRARFFKTLALGHLAKQMPDQVLRAKLTPNYPIGCKRVLFSDDYYPALSRENVSLVAEPIKRIYAEGIETRSGKKRPFDLIIYATGFETSSFNWSYDVIGRGGARLKEVWQDGPEAYLGLAVSGFPNFFMTYGPNTNLGHNSVLYMIERQAEYIVKCMKRMEKDNLGVMEVRRVAQEDFNRLLRTELAKTAWAGECGSWYKTAAGKITNNWIGTTQDYRRMTLAPDFSDYVLHPRVDYSLNEIRPMINVPQPPPQPTAPPVPQPAVGLTPFPPVAAPAPQPAPPPAQWAPVAAPVPQPAAPPAAPLFAPLPQSTPVAAPAPPPTPQPAPAFVAAPAPAPVSAPLPQSAPVAAPAPQPAAPPAPQPDPVFAPLPQSAPVAAPAPQPAPPPTPQPAPLFAPLPQAQPVAAPAPQPAAPPAPQSAPLFAPLPPTAPQYPAPLQHTAPPTPQPAPVFELLPPSAPAAPPASYPAPPVPQPTLEFAPPSTPAAAPAPYPAPPVPQPAPEFTLPSTPATAPAPYPAAPSYPAPSRYPAPDAAPQYPEPVAGPAQYPAPAAVPPQHPAPAAAPVPQPTPAQEPPATEPVTRQPPLADVP